MRPDLVGRPISLHWHGFRHVIPFFDGEPMGSVSMPIDRNFTYCLPAARPSAPICTTAMREDIGTRAQGMTGMVFVRPAQNGQGFYQSGRTPTTTATAPPATTARFSMLLTEVWSEAHWDDSHIQLPEWTD